MSVSERYLFDDEDAEVYVLSTKQRDEMTQQGFQVGVAVTERDDDRHMIPGHAVGRLPLAARLEARTCDWSDVGPVQVSGRVHRL